MPPSRRARWSSSGPATVIAARSILGGCAAHRYDDTPAAPAAPITWDASTPGMPATFDGTAVLDDDDALRDWLVALRDLGLTRLRGVPLELDAVRHVAERIGPIRETNFGLLWDVRSEPAPITNANTPLALPPHVDLPTREYQPGLQFLHCLSNTAAGGHGRYVDGFRVAEVLRAEQPEHFEILDERAMAVGQPLDDERLSMVVATDRPRPQWDGHRDPVWQLAAVSVGGGFRLGRGRVRGRCCHGRRRQPARPRRPPRARARTTSSPSTTGASSTAVRRSTRPAANACCAAATASGTSCTRG